MSTLKGCDPRIVLPHGPSKILVDEYVWHSPDTGIVATYSPNDRDVADHFGIFRASDQLESFGQAAVVSCCAFLETQKTGLNYKDYYKQRNFLFTGVGNVSCRHIIKANQKYLCLGLIQSYKFRRMVCSGRIYILPDELNVDACFTGFTDKQLREYDLDNRFILATEIHDVSCHAVPVEKIKFKT